eukprot:m.228800 g.228800  ORF g.228800 m.228800 type:complete len:140 (-) comp11791_c0_seq1:1489-1908(-)
MDALEDDDDAKLMPAIPGTQPPTHAAAAPTLEEFKEQHPTWFYELPPRAQRTAKTYLEFPFRKGMAMKRRMVGSFGTRFIVMLTSGYMLVKGGGLCPRSRQACYTHFCTQARSRTAGSCWTSTPRATRPSAPSRSPRGR